ncbi:tRNA 5-methoxyuridine(34)/uridine 5-oxyacetic acid(34) synthase CmoB [Porticoccus sp. W117]|uniref:tRNA 5-methoxyuridine(34)/uridine 5-oxyacetic acid(34) synthase CmoB n=1 Tax=Porticoccus sp. W117 TaxID=3054777 RepID=UPI0025976167|nr:tRNA 5-methoxyuridine(34)/uridine 5-oxyacetic acid(34) synthase CmoB [Porticoccus sp. W117]MDM3872002.1 tRNA 5-methoxyuridine(34)/uridine 5-oxyacetic acid(34) synthase CmoB [Porticoccus sp. W117]
MIDYSPLIESISTGKLKPWAELLPQQIAQGLSQSRWGDLPQWQAALEQLPDIEPGTVELKANVTIGNAEDCDEETREHLRNALMELHPWRKGPFELFGVHIDTEWRSDWKWDRVLPHLSPLKNRTILDVGCGNGYHCLRMLGEGAHRVIGIDPSPRFVMQFYALKKYLGPVAVDILPVGIEKVPANLQAFDTVFSMGVFYHRRSPMDHLRELKACLRPGGELVLETLVVEGPQGHVLVPEGRYAKMPNVWFLPSSDTLISWLNKCGFRNPRLVDSSVTTTEEQRATEWMRFESLQDFLDPTDAGKTVEGHPAPLRAVFVAEAP